MLQNQEGAFFFGIELDGIYLTRITRGQGFIVIVDKYSEWPVVTPFRQHSVNSVHVIRAVKGMMMEKGIPMQFHSYGGPQFVSRKFSKFCEDWDYNTC